MSLLLLSKNGLYYFFVDDKGRKIISKGASSDSIRTTIDFRSLIEKDTKSLTFIHYKFRDDYKPNSNIYDMSRLLVKIS